MSKKKNEYRLLVASLLKGYKDLMCHYLHIQLIFL